MAKIFVSFNVVSPSDVILVVRELDNLAGEVYREFFAAPHTLRNFTVDEIEPVMHRIEVWRTVDGVTLLQKFGSCDIDASITDNTAFEIKGFVVDGSVTGSPQYDPPSGQAEYPNPDLDGKSYTVFQPGFGPLRWGVHIETMTGGGFRYIDGQQFSSGAEYTIMVSNIIQTHITGSGKSFPDGIVEVTGDITFDSTHHGKLLEANAGAIITIDIADFNVIPNNTKFGINTHNGTQRNVVITMPVANFCKIEGEDRNPVYIGRGEEVVFMKNGDHLRIVSGGDGFRRVGEVIEKDGKPPLNSIGEIGGWLLQADYPRIFNWYVNELPSDELGVGTKDVTPDGPNKTKWIIDDDAFWVPDTREYFFRHTDASRKSGDNQAELVGPHFHEVETQNLAGSGDFRRAKLHPVRAWTAPPKTDADQNSSTNLNRAVSSDITYASENRPKNVARKRYRLT